MKTNDLAGTGFDVDRLIELRRVTNLAPSPCGTWLAVAVQRLDADGARYVSDLWKLMIDASGDTDAAIQLTRGDSKDTAPCFLHDGSLAFLSNRKPNDIKPDDAADQRMQVWMLPRAGGEPVQLTDEPLGVAAFKCAAKAACMVLIAPVLPGIAHDDQRKVQTERSKNGPSALRYTQQSARHWDAWLSDERTGPHAHLIAYALDAGVGTQRRDLTPAAVRELAVEPGFDVSADGRSAVCTWASIGPDRIPDLALRVFDLATGAARMVGTESRITYETPRFAPDGVRIAALRGVRRAGRAPQLRLAMFDAGTGTGTRTDIAPDWDAWPHLHDWTRDGRALIAGADRHGRTAVFRVDVATGAVQTIVAEGSCSDVACIDDLRIAGLCSRLAQAPEAFVAPLASTAGAAQAPRLPARLADTALPAVTVEELEVASTDGTAIHTFLLKPAQATGKLPLVMFIHGGPVHAFSDGWHWRWNPLLLVARGYAVALPNPRGSTGYGGDFIEGIWNNQWGAQCFEDLMAVTDALCARPDIDATRTAAMGGSFGGYMTNWIGGQTDRFRCLITHASVYWMQAFTGTTDAPPYWFYEMNATPDTPAAEFDRYSPHAYARNWKSPVLIIHGEKDYRCPISESLMLFEALQGRGVASELLVFPDENHWILKPRNIRAWVEAVGEFLDRHLMR